MTDQASDTTIATGTVSDATDAETDDDSTDARDADRNQDTPRPADGRLVVDLRDRVAEIDDRLDEIQKEAAHLDRESAEWADLEEEHGELLNARDDILRSIDEWGGSEFAIKTDSTWGDQLQVNDLVRGDMTRDNQRDPRTKLGALKARMVQVYVTRTPPDAPTRPHEYPPAVGEYLYQRIDAVTRFGELGIESGNSSLEAALDGTD